MNPDREHHALLAPHDSQAPGGWGRRDAAHLLSRAGFAATQAEIERAVGEGLSKTLDRLLSPQPETDDFKSAEGWLRQAAHETGSIADLKAWWLYRMLYSANPLVERMTLFWHNHFATSNAKVRSAGQMEAQNALFRQKALGRFRELVQGVARDAAMTVWLDGNANRKRQPNENFARELMELFTLGVGHYTERDIEEAARAFTGWHVRDGKFWFNRLQHDFAAKTVFGRSGPFDGDDVVDLCLAQPACPRFLAHKLLRRFVSSSPASDAIDPLAGRIRAHDFQMTPVLRELLGSRLFFASASRHSIIKSPVALVVGAYRTLGVRANLQASARLLADLGQDLFEPPTVKGWEGGRLWINSATMLQRVNFAAELTSGDRFGSLPDPSQLVKETDARAVVRSCAELLLARDVSAEAIGRLGDTFEKSRGTFPERLRSLIYTIMAMPEYQLT